MAGGCDDDFLSGCSALRAYALDGLDDVHALDDGAEHDVLAVQPRGLVGAQEELGAVGVGAGVGHGEDARARVAELEVLVLEFVPVDRLTSSTVVVGEVTSLNKHQFKIVS